MRAFVRASKDQRLPGIGELRHRIMVARRKRDPEGDTAFKETMTLTHTLWSRKTNLEGIAWSGGASDQEQPWPTHEFLVRRAPSYRNEEFDRGYVIHKGIRYHIGSLWEYDTADRFLGLICTVEQTDPNRVKVPWVLLAEDGQTLIGE